MNQRLPLPCLSTPQIPEEPNFSSKAPAFKKGEGLSRAICRTILLAHGGNARIESKEGAGSTFEVLLQIPPAALPTTMGADPS